MLLLSRTPAPSTTACGSRILNIFLGVELIFGSFLLERMFSQLPSNVDIEGRSD
jgi:hypothetical protein